MAIFKKSLTNKKFFFIHIPRTAGRFVEFNLENCGWRFDSKSNLNCKTRYDIIDGIELSHFPREYYQKYLDVKNIPHIAIVRNPVDKFISASFLFNDFYGSNAQELMENPVTFFSIISSMLMREPDKSFYLPQVDFLSNKTHIWKYEDGFGNYFSEWISSIVGIKIKMVEEWDDIYERIKSCDESNKLDKTDSIIYNVMQFYRQDIEKLYPELAASLQKGTETKT